MQKSLFNEPITQDGVRGPQFNEDGYSVKGASYIYAPKGQAGEYSPLAANPYRGCGHKCAYCYVPAVLRMDRTEFDQGAINRPNFIIKLMIDARKYQQLGSREQVMLSFTTDVCNATNRSLTRPTIEVLKVNGLGFCILTKGGSRALEYIDLFRPSRDAFASTLTSLNESFSLKWERGAALPENRINTLKLFHERGIFTWVSLEPTLDVFASLEIIKETHKFVDLFKIGRVNYLPMTKTTDWGEYTLRMLNLVNKLGIKAYFKKDLQPYLPVGYPNPLRVQQHH